MTSGILSRLTRIFKPVLLAFLIASLYLPIASATHLVGGSITYKYLGKSTKTGLYNYFVHIEMYRDCQHSSILFSSSITLGVYERTIDTPQVRYYSLSGDSVDPAINKTKEFAVSPPGAAKSCTFNTNTCFSEGIFDGIISLPASTYGYYLFFETCCRNSMINVPGTSQGQNYFAIIPPTSTVNTSPFFNAVPAPYICANDTVSLLYAATEPDGDSLVYTLAVPYGGGGGGPNPSAPGSWPYSTVTPNSIPLIPYNTGYSVVKPLGSTGYASLDKHTGILTLYATIVGSYALAVDVHEYRKGKQISVTRRDVQIIVINCPVRKAPERVSITDSLPIDNGTPTIYNIEAGSRLAFNIKYVADSAGLANFSETGFFDKPNNLIHQPIFNYSINGEYVTAYFSWQTTCKDASVSPHIFTITVADSGCPAKTTYQGIEIYVNPFIGVKSLQGPNPACQGIPPSLYFVNKPGKGDSLTWNISGGTILYKPNDSSILVNWANSSGIITAAMQNQYGCGGDTLSRKIIVNTKPPPPVLNGPNNACAYFTSAYTVSTNSKETFFWKVIGGTLSNISSNTKTIFIKWPAANPSATVLVCAKDSIGCFSDTTELKVMVAPPVAAEIYGSVSVCPNSNAIDYWTTAQKGATYNWFVSGGTIITGGNGPQITINWGNLGTGTVKMYEVTAQGCVGDTVTLLVKKDYKLFTSSIVGDTSTCEYDVNVPYSVTKNTGSFYSWQISGGSITSGNGKSAILVDWDSAGSGVLMVTETAFDSINQRPCIGSPVSLNIDIHPRPNISPLIGPPGICEQDTAVFSVIGDSGSKFLWKINNQPVQNQSPTLFIHDTGFTKPIDTLHISVVKMAATGCESVERDSTLIVYKLPVTGNISGPGIVCAPNLDSVAYYVSGFPASTYNWNINGGRIIKGIPSNKILVNWTIAGIGNLQVQETNQNGCPGPVKTLPVKVDSFTIAMQYVSTEEADDKVIDVAWLPINNTFFNGYYKIYRETEGQHYFGLLDSITENHTFFTDKNVNTAQYAYSYKIVAENNCKAPVSTNINRSIKLSDAFDGDTTIHLRWTPYMGWPVNEYAISAGLNADTSLLIYGLTPDTIYPVIKTLQGYRQCMRIRANESGVSNIVSLSNEICINFDPLVWIPDIFTPHNGDDLNNTFHIFASNYSSYSLNIFNRWGENIFSSDNPTVQWDGTYKGIDCMEGIYLYMLTVKGEKDYIYRSGTVELAR